MISDSPDNPYYYSNRRHVFEPGVLPSGVLCWDNISTGVLEQSPLFSHCDIRKIGNPWFIRFAEGAPDDHLVREAASKLQLDTNKGPIILVTLQYNLHKYASDYVPEGLMADALRQVIINNSQYTWLVRLHPSHMHDADRPEVLSYIEEHFGTMDNVIWDRASKAPIPMLLKLIALHLTHFSSTTIEASWFGVPTGLLDPHICPGGKHASFYQKEIQSDMAEVVPLQPKAIEVFIRQRLSKQSNSAKTQFNQKALNQLLNEYLGAH